jgi:hypothetical protein
MAPTIPALTKMSSSAIPRLVGKCLKEFLTSESQFAGRPICFSVGLIIVLPLADFNTHWVNEKALRSAGGREVRSSTPRLTITSTRAGNSTGTRCLGRGASGTRFKEAEASLPEQGTGACANAAAQSLALTYKSAYIYKF